jgi:hypothetical protein
VDCQSGLYVLIFDSDTTEATVLIHGTSNEICFIGYRMNQLNFFFDVHKIASSTEKTGG